MKRTEKIIEDYLLEETLEIHPSGSKHAGY